MFFHNWISFFLHRKKLIIDPTCKAICNKTCNYESPSTLWSKGIDLLLLFAGRNCTSMLQHDYFIGIGHGIGIGAGIGAGIGLVIRADATVANAVNMATATTTFIAFITDLQQDLNYFSYC